MEDQMEPLEKLFRQVEEESERRAQIESATSGPMASDGSNHGGPTLTRCNTSQSSGRRRGGSVSMTRFGQLSASDRKNSSPSISHSVIGSRLPFYQTQQDNHSFESFTAGNKFEEGNDGEQTEDDQLVTHVYKVRTRGSISKAVGDFLPRRLSRSYSEQLIPQTSRDGPMVVGVHVEQATVEVTCTATGESEERLHATVHAPNSICRRTSRASVSGTTPSSRANWLDKAKDLTQKFRQRSKTVLTPPA